jgi:acyl carrier protein phosphodiesterase
MNFLAHLFLSGEEDSELRIGNFMADWLRGNQFDAYPQAVRRGIALHRAIDHFTDTHPLIRQGIRRLHPTQAKYAPIAIDIFYDHFLAIHWAQYHSEDLKSYTQKIYGELRTYKHLIPSDIHWIVERMIEQDWLGGYAERAGIKRTFEGLSKRVNFPSNLATADQDLWTHFSEFSQEFAVFFPEIIDFSMQKRKECQ